MPSPSESIRDALAIARRGLVEREPLVELVALAAVAREHALIVGPPGTAKSEAVRRVARVLGGTTFEYLLGRFTEPSEIFGPVDLRKLRDGTVETETRGMLPEADIAFLDEVFLGSTAILNTLLGVLNERTFVRGHTRIKCPLRVCVGASNQLPEDGALAAFADRFLVRLFVTNVPDPRLEDLLEEAWKIAPIAPGPSLLGALDQLSKTADEANLDALRPSLAHAMRKLRAEGIPLSDRRLAKVQRLVAAAAALADRKTPTEADLWPLIYAVPTEDAQKHAREILRDQLAAAENGALPAAAEDASAGPKARAQRLISAGKALLDAAPTDETARPAWRAKIEGTLREIDAGFVSESIDAELRDARAALASALAR